MTDCTDNNAKGGQEGSGRDVRFYHCDRAAVPRPRCPPGTGGAARARQRAAAVPALVADEYYRVCRVSRPFTSARSNDAAERFEQPSWLRGAPRSEARSVRLTVASTRRLGATATTSSQRASGGWTMLAYGSRASSVAGSCARDETDPTARPRRYEVTPQRFGWHVRALRQARGLTQERLAERSELSTDAIRRIEAGRLSPTLTTLSKLTRGLDVSLATLFKGIGRSARPIVQEIAEFLEGRSARECETAWRVVRALFEEP